MLVGCSWAARACGLLVACLSLLLACSWSLLLVYVLLPSYLPSAQAALPIRLFQFEKLIAYAYPKLDHHFADLGITPNMFGKRKACLLLKVWN